MSTTTWSGLKSSGVSGRCSKGSSPRRPTAVVLTSSSYSPACGAAAGVPPSSAARFAARSAVRFQTPTSAPSRASAQTAARAAPPAPRTRARLPRGEPGSAASSPPASVLSAAIVGTPVSAPGAKLSVLAAPISCATSLAESASASAASLCGTVTLAPAKPSPAIARTRASNSSGVTSTATYSHSPTSPSSASAALCIAGEREWPTGQPITASRGTALFPAGARGVAAVGFARLFVLGDRRFEFGFGLGEGQFVAGVGVVDVIDEFRLGRVGGGLQRGEAGTVDRARRQAGVEPRVVRRFDRQL